MSLESPTRRLPVGKFGLGHLELEGPGTADFRPPARRIRRRSLKLLHRKRVAIREFGQRDQPATALRATHRPDLRPPRGRRALRRRRADPEGRPLRRLRRRVAGPTGHRTLRFRRALRREAFQRSPVAGGFRQWRSSHAPGIFWLGLRGGLVWTGDQRTISDAVGGGQRVEKVGSGLLATTIRAPKAQNLRVWCPIRIESQYGGSFSTGWGLLGRTVNRGLAACPGPSWYPGRPLRKEARTGEPALEDPFHGRHGRA